jgi:hypothetical protein
MKSKPRMRVIENGKSRPAKRARRSGKVNPWHPHANKEAFETSVKLLGDAHRRAEQLIEFLRMPSNVPECPNWSINEVMAERLLALFQSCTGFQDLKNNDVLPTFCDEHNVSLVWLLGGLGMELGERAGRSPRAMRLRSGNARLQRFQVVNGGAT